MTRTDQIKSVNGTEKKPIAVISCEKDYDRKTVLPPEVLSYIAKRMLPNGNIIFKRKGG